MPYQGFDFSRFPISDFSPIRDWTKYVAQGENLRALPEVIQRQKEQGAADLQSRQLENALQGLKIGEETEMAPFNIAAKRLANKLTEQKANSPFGIETAPGIAGQYQFLHELQKAGPEYADVAQKLANALQLQQESQEGLNQYRQGLTENVDKRFSSPLGRLIMEQEQVSRNQFTPETQRRLDEYDLARQKVSSDSTARQKALLATNIDKTIEQINPDKLVKFSGLSGGAAKTFQQGLSLVNKESPDYDSYLKNVSNAEFLAHQIRQFYGDSIQPQMIERLNRLTNPTDWATNPKIAKQNYLALVDLLKRETKTYKKGIKSTEPFNIESENQGNADPMELF